MAPRGWDYEVAVIGGGPGGSSTAAMLARRGHKVILFERDEFPRFHIGESLLPWSNDIFDALGFADTLAQAGFVQKWGASFTNADGSTQQYADFSLAPETTKAQSYQVPRAQFDHLLLQHAARGGADVRERHRVQDAAFDADGVTLGYTDPEEVEHSVRVGMVVDASGRTGILAKKFGERQVDPVLRNIAVHAQFEGVPRHEGRRAGDIQMVTRPDKGWFWFIPLSEKVMSVGAVIPRSVHQVKARRTAEDSLSCYIAETPAAARLMAETTRVSAARFDADYSYLHTQHAGDRWVLVGDSGAFLDPIFSTGVILAMQGALEAARSISEGLAGGDLSRRRFLGFERRVMRRYRHFRRFAVGFYDPAFRDLFFRRGPFGIYESVLTVLGGNWNPSFRTRMLLRVFFGLVRLNRFVPIAPRIHEGELPGTPAVAESAGGAPSVAGNPEA